MALVPGGGRSPVYRAYGGDRCTLHNPFVAQELSRAEQECIVMAKHFAKNIFPPPALAADAEGLVAVTAKMDAALVLAAYREGIFPWSENPVRWFSPDPRAVFVVDEVTIHRRLARTLRTCGFGTSVDRDFTGVIHGCAEAARGGLAEAEGGEGTWITSSFLRAYQALHLAGFAHSIEVWEGDALVGGLYGVQLGGVFCGESMFFRKRDASKIAFVRLLVQLQKLGVVLIDAQVLNPHTQRLGAVCIPREDYLDLLPRLLRMPIPTGCIWEGPRLEAAALGAWITVASKSAAAKKSG